MTLSCQKKELELSPKIGFYPDSRNNIRGQDMLGVPERAYRYINDKIPYIGTSFENKSYWGKITLINSCEQAQRYFIAVEHLTLQNVVLYQVAHKKLSVIPALKYLQNFTFEINLTKNSSTTFYFHIQANGPYLVHAQLYDKTKLAENTLKVHWFFALFSGIVIAVMIFFSYMSVSLKKPVYFYFAMHLLSHLILWLTVFGLLRLFFPSIDLSLAKLLSVSASLIFVTLLAEDFLQLKTVFPRLRKLLLSLLFVIILYYFLGFYLEWIAFEPPLFGAISLSIYATIIYASIYAMIKSISEAKIFFFATIGYLIGYTITIVGVFASGLIPANNFTLYVGLFGVFIDMIFLSTALSIRIRDTYRKKHAILKSYSEDLERAVEEKTKILVAQNQQLVQISKIDPLTQLYNRMELDKQLNKAINESQERLLLLLDVDHFKNVNDTYGHIEGDRVLKELARVLEQSFKEGDIIGRWGGEEFIVLVKLLDVNEAESIAQRVCDHVAKHFASQKTPVTVSIGAALKNGSKERVDWIQRADAALYEAKGAGRNRIVLAT